MLRLPSVPMPFQAEFRRPQDREEYPRTCPSKSASSQPTPNKIKERDMKHILMMNTMKAGQGVPSWPQKDLQAHIAFMMNLNKDLRQAGELVSAEGLSFPDQARLVLAGKNGVPITD